MKTHKVIQLAEEYCSNRPKFSGHSIEEADAFVAGYQAATTWISVFDKVPEDASWVLCFDGKNVFIAQWDDECEYWCTERSGGLWASHWMSLPELPKKV